VTGNTRKPGDPPRPIPEPLLGLVAGGQNLQEMLDGGLITQQQFDWLSQHPSGAGRGG
jgi:hypothetical protein